MMDVNVQWYPGHMAKAKRQIIENLKLVDAICEIVDARIPISSRNPDIDEIVGQKPRMMILNRVDQADPNVTREWVEYFNSKGIMTIETNCKNGNGTAKYSQAINKLLEEKVRRYKETGQIGRTLKAMVVGVPNVGKSSFINQVSKKKAAKVEDRPGLTKCQQWVTVDKSLELLDTPGILWPKFDNRETGLRLAYTGAIKYDVLDIETIACCFCEFLKNNYPNALKERYKISLESDLGVELLEEIAKKRGCLISGGEVDYTRTANILFEDYRSGKLGRISLEKPER